MIGTTAERWREHWVHLGESPNKHRKHKLTATDGWVLMDIHSADYRSNPRLSGCTEGIDFPRWRI